MIARVFDGNGWIKHDGIECPVDKKTAVLVKLHSVNEAYLAPLSADHYSWFWDERGPVCGDITHYKVVSDEGCAVVSVVEKHTHYKKPCPYKFLDPYRVTEIFGVQHPALQHVLKKALCTGSRGHKDIHKDVQDMIDTLQRWQQMQEEDAEFCSQKP